jgi:hypothetical protein
VTLPSKSDDVGHDVCIPLLLSPPIARCPVCNKNLDEFGTANEQEFHVKSCLEGGSGSTPQAAKYLVYTLPAESALLGVECTCRIQNPFS